MQKLTLAAVLLTIAFSLTACGKVDFKKVEELTKEATYEVAINVNINMFHDPKLYIKAKEIEIDRANKKLMVKDTGFLTSVGRKYLGDPNTFAIKIENGAIFSTPLGGRITIKHPDGKIEVLEQY